MPTTYAHDVFGRAVYQKMSEEMRDILEKHKNAYLLGLHGPDLLFYYHPIKANPISQKGRTMHQKSAAPFFVHCKEYYSKTQDEEALAYIFGFICHYMLDSICHPYIRKYMEKTGARHDEIETELDRSLMKHTGKNPFHFKPAAHLQASKETVRAIASVLELSEKTVRKSIRSMRFYTGLTVCKGSLKRIRLFWLMKILGVYEDIQGHVMRKRPLRRCEQSSAELLVLMKLAIPETLTVLEDFYATLDEIGYVNGRFERNYE